MRSWQDRLTPRGRYLLWVLGLLALMGLDTRTTQIYVLFAGAAGLLAMATLFALRGRPPVTLTGGLPMRLTAGARATVELEIGAERPVPDLVVTLRAPAWVGLNPAVSYASAPGRLSVTLAPTRRGRAVLPGPRVRGTDPLGLMATRSVSLPDRELLVYPRYFTMDRFEIPLGRRHQPGGIPLVSHTGDAVEFVGTRDYRPGDPVRTIHWRSWARRGAPVVKEYQEEYFCRIAVVLDTSVKQPASFEAAVSVVASIADFFSRSEYIVDILAAGPDIYEVSMGRSLGYFENIMDVLAGLEPSPEAPFAGIGPALFDRLAQITTVVAVLQDWDEPRERFLRRVKDLGTGVRATVVRDGAPTRDWGAAADLGVIDRMSTADVERALR